MENPSTTEHLQNTLQTIQSNEPLALENVSNGAPPPTPNPSPSREKMLHEQNLILSRELKTSVERYISLIQYLKLEGLKQEQVIQVLTESNEALKKELHIKEKQIVSLTVLAEGSEFSSEHSEDRNQENYNNGANENTEQIKEEFLQEKEKMERQLLDLKDKVMMLETDNQTLGKKHDVVESQNQELRKKNLEYLQDMDHMRKLFNMQTEGLQRMESERNQLMRQMEFMQKEKLDVVGKVDMTKKENVKLKQKMECCEEYIKELEKRVGMNSQRKFV
jgi:hypothetical protein